MKLGILFSSLASVLITFLLVLLSIHFYLYWSVPWIDTAAHFFGGLSVGLFFFWWSVRVNWPRTLLSILLWVLLIGVLWEIFEYGFGITHYSISFIFDTLSDLSMDLSGGVLAFLLASLMI